MRIKTSDMSDGGECIREDENFKSAVDAAGTALNKSFGTGIAQVDMNVARYGLQYSAEVAGYQARFRKTSFIDKVTMDSTLRSQLKSTIYYASGETGGTTANTCTGAESLLSFDGVYKAVVPKLTKTKFETATAFWKTAGPRDLETIQWTDDGTNLYTLKDFSRLQDIQVAKQKFIDACDQSVKTYDTKVQTLKSLSEDATGDPLKDISDDSDELRNVFDVLTVPTAFSTGVELIDLAANRRALNRVANNVGDGIGAAASRDPLVRNDGINNGLSPDEAADPEALRRMADQQSEEQRQATRETWRKWIGGGLATALKFVFRDLLVDAIIQKLLVYQLAAITELIFVYFVVYVWGPDLVNALNRFLLSLSTCAVLMKDSSARTYAFSCDWSSVASDDQFMLNASGAWCGAPDCYPNTNDASFVDSPSQWGLERPNSSLLSGGQCNPDPQLSSKKTTGAIVACPQQRQVGGYAWRRVGLDTTLGAIVAGVENLGTGLGAWFSMNGWMLVAGVVLLLVVIIPLISHFISKI